MQEFMQMDTGNMNNIAETQKIFLSIFLLLIWQLAL